jgi:sugar O-acyltransferase (sialic acid O-acetyltransferase NeuD family)
MVSTNSPSSQGAETVKPLVVFGAGQIAELALHYFRTDSEREVVALTVDAAFVDGERIMGLPVIPFESLASDFPPEEFDLFVALSYKNRNRIRRERFLAGRDAGYRFASYVSSRATILNGHDIGENCFILEDNTIQPIVQIGDNTTLWSGNHIGHHSKIGSHIFVASHVVISGNVTVEDGTFLGVNATLRDGITVGEEAIIGAGALVMEDVPPRAVLAPAGTPQRDR